MSAPPIPSSLNWLIDRRERLAGEIEKVHEAKKERMHSGKHCVGKTPMQTLTDSKHLAHAKQLDRTLPATNPETALA